MLDGALGAADLYFPKEEEDCVSWAHVELKCLVGKGIGDEMKGRLRLLSSTFHSMPVAETVHLERHGPDLGE